MSSRIRETQTLVAKALWLGRRVGGCSGHEGRQQPASLWEVEKAYENVFEEGESKKQLVTLSVLVASWSPSVKAALVVTH